MADEKVEVDADGWGERDDWAAAPPPATPPQPRPKRSLWFAAGGGVLFVALMATLVLRRADTAREQAEAEQQAALDARAQGHKGKGRGPRPKPPVATDPGPQLDPADALRVMAADADALGKLGAFRLDTGDVEGAVVALRDAAKLDPKYAPDLDVALKRKAELGLQREREAAAAAAGGGPALALPPPP